MLMNLITELWKSWGNGMISPGPEIKNKIKTKAE